MKLHYFDVGARGESIRMMLTHAKADWEDVRSYTRETMKAKSFELGGNGQGPMLEIDGKAFNQSVCTLRMLAIKLGYMPEDPMAAYDADRAVSTVEEMLGPHFFFPFMKEGHDEEVQAKALAMQGNVLKQLSEQLGDKKYFGGGDKASYGDWHVYAWLCSISMNPKPNQKQVQMYAACAK